MDDNGQKNGWAVWSKHVLKELERLQETLDKMDGRLRKLDKDIGKIETEMAILKTKMLFIGSGAGVFTSTIITLLIAYFKGNN